MFFVEVFDGLILPTQMKFEKATFHVWALIQGTKIGASVGDVEDVDVPDGEVGWGEYLRVRLNLDLSKPLTGDEC